jgi:DNA-binding CsgD family transcriptional regulator
VESEIELAYAGLHLLCAPFMDRLDALPRPQSEALATAFGLRDSTPPDRFMVGLAVLTLLTNAAEEQPVVCLIDDAQWLDRASAQTLSFVARRLLADRVVMVFSLRHPTDEDGLTAFTALSVRGLDAAEAGALLDSVVPWPLESRVRARLLRETGGNPLALLELPRGLSRGELAFGFADATTMPLVTRIEDGFLRRLLPLPGEAKRLLLVAALQPDGDAAVVWRAADRLGIDVAAAAAPAVEGGLLEKGVTGNAAVQFRHPLVRSAVYRAAIANEVREVHGALAEVTDGDKDPDYRAWHRAQAIVFPNDQVAEELEGCAARAQARGGLAAAAAFLERAVALSADPLLRARRALAAAQTKHQAGAPEEALALLAIAEAGPLDSLERALVHLARAQIAFFSQHGGDAPALLLAAARELEPLEAGLARQTYLDALTAAMFAGRLSGAVGIRDVAGAARAAPRPAGAEGPSDLLLDGLALVITEGYAAGAAALQEAVSAFLVAGMPVEESLRWLWLATHAAHDLWDDESWRELSDRHVALARQLGALHVLPIALSTRMGLHLFSGELSTVGFLVHEAATVTQATGSTLPPYGAIALAAWQGRETEVARLCDAVTAEVVSRGDGMGLTLIRHAQAVMYNGLGRYPEALAAATEAAAHPEELSFATWSLAEVVEAAVRTGNVAPAEGAVLQLSEIAGASGTDWARGVLARCQALLADHPTSAEGHYVEAIALLGRTRLPMVLARGHLLYGEWLRRQGRREEARDQLRTAYSLFEQMGAEAFAERTRRELAATGETARRSGTSGLADALSAQETQIARLAVGGMTNIEIGADLFISPRTVEWHLRKVYAKLGVTSRKHLRTALLVDRHAAASA